ncbi:MAG TPA: S9 family peptidase [Gemmatimonadaceae bacterium]|nr:S9 family peptidase [Gemmatimonadaceae bacterium]
MSRFDPMRRSRLAGALAALLCCLAIGAPASSQRSTAPSVRQFSSVAMAPDGRHVAWIGPASPNGDAESVMLGATGGTAPVALSLPGAQPNSASEVIWSADSRQLGVLAERNGSPAIYAVDASTRAARRVAVVAGSVHDIRFSPDGSRIALLYASPSEEANGPTQATPRDTGAMDTHIDRQHLALVDVKTGAQRIVSPADLYVYEFDWSPNGKELVVSAATGSGNNNWWVARLEAIDAASGAVREIAKPAVQIAQPLWSPDGSRIAFIGGIMSDQGSTGGDLYTVPAAGGTPRDLTPNATVSVAAIRWQGPHAMLATMWSHGGSEIATVNAATGAIASLWEGDEAITTRSGRGLPVVSAADSGRQVALVRESLGTPPEVWAGPVGHWTELTHANAGIAPSWGKAVSVHWHSDRFNVQGFLIYPRDFRSGTRYPMIVLVHGGPAAAVAPTFLSAQSQQAALSRAGYFVFMPNPRGSFGQGEAFTRANIKDFGHGDLRDIMAGVDSVIARYPVDPQRLGLTGWSYGGYMTMWAVTQTQRFRAAVAGAGISDWLSYTGENGISEWMVPYFGSTVYENAAVYARSSPMNYIAHARTPTLIVVGERDAECPAPQSFEYWRGLQHEGVKTQLVVYPDEGHHFANPAHQADVLRRSIAWFDSYLKPRPPG